MTASAIQLTMHLLHSAGLHLTLTPKNGIKVSPASAITDAMRALIVLHKVDIVAYLSDAANDSTLTAAKDMHPDRWCWPNSTAMNTAEIATFAARFSQFKNQGVGPMCAEAIADQLVQRDRCMDDRILCLECCHLADLRCNIRQAASIENQAAGDVLGVEWTSTLRQCSGFAQALRKPPTVGVEHQCIPIQMATKRGVK